MLIRTIVTLLEYNSQHALHKGQKCPFVPQRKGSCMTAAVVSVFIHVPQRSQMVFSLIKMKTGLHFATTCCGS